jgi:hypothetical protein
MKKNFFFLIKLILNFFIFFILIIIIINILKINKKQIKIEYYSLREFFFI